jgi:8-hydroxy-5-deazaflavin:NADPH oxidoreductase
MGKPKIAIIGGTGKEGRGLTLRWASAGYEILIGSRQAEKARQAAEEINQRLSIKTILGMENSEAIKNADICVLTVIQSAHLQILENLKEILQGKILVDATVRVDFRDPRPPDPPSAAQQAQEVLGPGVRIVAAFQNIPAKALSIAIEEPIKADVLVCSDDIEAAEQVIQLVNAAGMRGFYAGILANANVVEGLTSILISMNKYYGIKDSRIIVSGI